MLDSWLVTISSPAVGTLYRGTCPEAEVHSGLSYMPIPILLRAKSCVPF